ncbi:hypothetical protein [Halostella pelagica]|uniref:hypothetical protein n=1 Tax=Halostella pelagica TaxID=2583824 RepID=UPI001081CCAC|nr:hypothetical protein [Halostella pelagica]
MTGNHHQRRRLRIRRRTFLAGVSGIAYSFGTGTSAAAQETEEDGQETDDGQGTEEEGEVQATREIVLQEQGDPWNGNYVGQFMIATYRPDDQGSIPAAVGDCEMDWGVNEALRYNGMLVDRIRDDPQRREVEMYVDGTTWETEMGTPFIITRKSDCTDEFIRLTIETVPPDRGEVATGSGPTVEGEPDENGTNTDTGDGMPGFGALVAGTGIAGGVATRLLRSKTSESSE